MVYVRNIEWERIHLYIDLEADDDLLSDEGLRFFLVNQFGEVKVELRRVSYAQGILRLTLNITNNGINRCIGNGTYKIFVCNGEELLTKPIYEGTTEVLAAWGRNFNYLTNKGVYTAGFMVDEYSDLPELQLLFYNSRICTYSDKPPVDEVVPKPPFKERMAKKYKPKIQRHITRMYGITYRFFRFFNKHRKTILFLSEKDEKLALNMAAVYNRIKQRGLDKEYHVELSLRNTENIEYSKWSSAKMIAKIAKASVIIVDDHIPFFDNFLLDRDVVMIQIWHAGAGFKGVGYSRWGHYGCPGIFSCHRQYTYCISPSKAICHFFSEQFGILDEQIIPTGMARMDSYMDPKVREETTERIYRDYPALKDKKVVLFAPTYRGQNRKTANYPYELIDFEGLYRYTQKNDAVVLFKMHPWVPGDVPIEEKYADRFFSMNTYPNINELFYVTDLLITDYSSSMYEFLLMEKPMLFFPFDKNQYSVSRGFHRDYDSNVPGKICYTFDELLTAMNEEDYEFEKVQEMLHKYFDNVDTHNCDRIIDWLVLGNLPEEYRVALQKKKEQIKKVRSIRFEVETPDILKD